MSESTHIIFRRKPNGLPISEDFELVRSPTPAVANGQFLVENLYLSLDPYVRMLMDGETWTFRGAGLTPGQVMPGRCVGVVRESRHPAYAAGQHLVGHFGWQTHAVQDEAAVEFSVPPQSGVPLSAWLGACGATGLTAWLGLQTIGEPRPGETVVVSAAAGSVGSAAGQLARAWGCRVIGIAGGDEKCRLVTEEFGFDAACDYKRPDFARDLRDQTPDGVDVYFDNVGGAMLDEILARMNPGGRIPVCGVLSQYNLASEFPGLRNTRLIFDKRLRMQGYLVTEGRHLWPRARAELEAMVAAGKLNYRETVAEGLPAAPGAFIRMLQGGNIGKQLVRVAP